MTKTETLAVQNGLQLSALVEVVKCAGEVVSGNDIASGALGHEFGVAGMADLIASRLKLNLDRCLKGANTL